MALPVPDGEQGLSRRPRVVSAEEAIRVPPHSVEAEQAVLGGLMLDNTTWDAIADRITSEDFYRRDHQLIFAAIPDLAARGEPSDAVTLAEFLDRQGKQSDTGGLAYLATLVRETPSAANSIRAYADIVRERSQLRRLIRVGGEIAASASMRKVVPRSNSSTRPSGACSRSRRAAARRDRDSWR